VSETDPKGRSGPYNWVELMTEAGQAEIAGEQAAVEALLEEFREQDDKGETGNAD
jgi:hypothetical protein